MINQYFKCYLCLCLLLVHLSGFSKPLKLSVSAKSAILINAENKKILFEKNAKDKLSPASTTKVVSCLLALEQGVDLDREVVCPRDKLIKITREKKTESGYVDPPYILEPDATSYGIYSMERLTIRDLIYGMMLPSGNDAANVLAHYLDENGIDGFMNRVNMTLKKVGAFDSHFANPHGLYYPGHTSTAYDLAILSAEAIKNEEFVKVVSAVNYQRPKTNKQPGRTVWNSNRLLRKGRFFYPNAFGIKTGYHSTAGHTFIGAAKDKDRTLICVVLGCDSYDMAFADSIRLFDAAFTEKKLARKLLNAQDVLYTLPVKGAKEPIKAVLKEDIIYEYFPSEEEEILPKIVWNKVEMPFKAGDAVGEIQVLGNNQKVLLTQNLYAKENAIPSIGYNMRAICSTLVKVGIISVIVTIIGLAGFGMYKVFRKLIAGVFWQRQPPYS